MKLNEINNVEDDFFNQLSGTFTERTCLGLLKEYLNNIDASQAAYLNSYLVMDLIKSYLTRNGIKFEDVWAASADQSLQLEDNLISVTTIAQGLFPEIQGKLPELSVSSTEGWKFIIKINRNVSRTENKIKRYFYSSTVQNKHKNTLFYKLYK